MPLLRRTRAKLQRWIDNPWVALVDFVSAVLGIAAFFRIGVVINVEISTMNIVAYLILFIALLVLLVVLTQSRKIALLGVFGSFLLIFFISNLATSLIVVSILRQSPLPSQFQIPPNSPGVEVNYFQMRGELEGRTSIQKSQYFDSLRGQVIDGWVGWVDNVAPRLSGDGILLKIDMHEPGFNSMHDVEFYISEEIAATLEDGQPVAFSGVIVEAKPTLLGQGLRLVLENATVEPVR